MTIAELLTTIDERPLPLVAEGEIIAGVLQTMVKFPHTRLIYVVDDQRRCTGTISLGVLIRHLFAHGFEPAVHSRHLIPMITSESAADIMNRQLIYAVKEDKVGAVVRRMIKAGVKEIAVLDQERHLIGDLTMLDLLKHYHLGSDAL
jgi:CBS domain-containing protein